jgi:two-component system nitrate/nitrite response regulator NarL
MSEPEDRLELTAAVLNRIQAGFSEFLAQFSKDLSDPRLLPAGDESRQEPLQLRFEVAGYRYQLTRTVVPPSNSAELTKREKAIARLVVSALSNKAIADRLGIQAPTVATHLRSIFKKLGVSSRMELTTRVMALT